MFVLDTNVLSEIRKNPANQTVVDWIRNHDEESLYITSINIFEIKRGGLDVPEQDTRQTSIMNRWLDGILRSFQSRTLPLDTESALRAAEANKRTNIDMKDCMIGAIADHHKMTVVTRNEKHLARVARRVINPWES
ncbi:type II toxin-antitoxin system VapC family toxin [Microlunatus sp. GCM10028923]|uniref:type II toxin-antitoxin system VapC family toxin n=1 Tax=Microlunatus sp. GCM10028923 TaxID=3273400 RepID=UPI003622BDF0